MNLIILVLRDYQIHKFFNPFYSHIPTFCSTVPLPAQQHFSPCLPAFFFAAMYAYAGYMQVLLGILFLALLYSGWQLAWCRRRYHKKIILPAAFIVAKGRILSMESAAIVWNNSRVYTVRLLVIPPAGNPFITALHVVQRVEKLQPIHDGIVIAVEYTGRQKRGKVWIRSMTDKNHSIIDLHDSSTQNDGSLNSILKGP